MKKVIALFASVLIFLNLQICAQTVRPVRDDIGFCWNADEMDRFIQFLFADGAKESVKNGKLVAAISPHDDYLYAGKIYFPLFRQIKVKEAIIFGVTHGTVRKEIGDPKNILILDQYDYWSGPYGRVPVSKLRDKLKNQLPSGCFAINNKAQSLEHSIEALIPFLQHYNRDIAITPIMVTQSGIEKLGKISDALSSVIFDYMSENRYVPGKDVIFLFSNDANHYGVDFNNLPYGLDANAHLLATENDKRIINECLTGLIDSVKIKNLASELLPDSAKSSRPIWCGRYPILLGLMTVEKIVAKMKQGKIYGELFEYSDTFTGKVLPFNESTMGLTAPFSLKHWVGFFSAGFYLK